MSESKEISNQGIRRCPNCGEREVGTGVVCMKCFWRDGIYSRYTGECELRKWADELDAAGVLNGGKKMRQLANTIRKEREEIDKLISNWTTGKLVVKEESDELRHRVDTTGGTPRPTATPDTQCGC